MVHQQVSVEKPPNFETVSQRSNIGIRETHGEIMAKKSSLMFSIMCRDLQTPADRDFSFGLILAIPLKGVNRVLRDGDGTK